MFLNYSFLLVKTQKHSAGNRHGGNDGNYGND